MNRRDFINNFSVGILGFLGLGNLFNSKPKIKTIELSCYTRHGYKFAGCHFSFNENHSFEEIKQGILDFVKYRKFVNQYKGYFNLSARYKNKVFGDSISESMPDDILEIHIHYLTKRILKEIK